MKKKKIIALMSIALIGNYFITFNCTALAFAEPLKKVVETKQTQDVSINKSILNKDKLSEVGLDNSKISFENWWGINAGYISFNTSNMKFNVVEYNPLTWLGHNSNKYLSIIISNPNTGKICYKKSFTGESSSADLSEFLNNKSFEYGDIVTLEYSKDEGQINVLNNGKTISNNSIGMESFEITKSGLVKPKLENIKLNNLDILGNGTVNVNEAKLTGQVNPNAGVNVLVNGKLFTCNSDKNGEFNINIEDSNGFTLNTPIIVTSKDRMPIKITPELNSSVKIQNSEIKINNGWGSNAGKITFNPLTMTFNVSEYNAYLGHNSNNFLNILVCNPTTGKFILKGSLNGNMNTSSLSNLMNTKSFQYGDVICISYDSSQGHISFLNGKSNILNNFNSIGTTQYFKITKQGLVPFKNNLKVNTPQILNGTKVTSGIVTGQTYPNSNVTATLNGEVFRTKSDSNGKFSVNVNDKSGFTKYTNIMVSATNSCPVEITPGLSSSFKIQNSEIKINNGWGSNAGKITFNPFTMTFNVSEYNAYLGHNSNNFLNILVCNPATGKFILKGSLNGNMNTSSLSNLMNTKSFQYGDVIGISYDSSQGHISFLNGKSDILNTFNSIGTIQYFKITKQGLVPFKNNLKVNPLQILNGTKVTSGIVTGQTYPNINVTATLNGEVFRAKSDSNGKFSINVNDKSGFTGYTPIIVKSINSCPVKITPKAQANLGILKSKIMIHGEDGVIAQNITFNPNTMTVSNSDPWGEQFSAQIIDKDTGKVVASCSTSNFNVFNSKNNLNGATFKYGDIISIYETEETFLSIGRPLLIQGSKSTDISTVGKFKSYEITPNGLVPVANKNFQITSDTYKGSQMITLSGKTLPNTKVKVFLSKMVKEVESDSNGNFSVNVPLSETGIGQEIRFYVNNQNNKNIVLGYDSNIFNINKNNIQILNNESVLVINIGFTPTSNTINATMYPIDKTYAGVFYGNHINIALINPNNGEVIKDVTGSRPQDIPSFINQINNQKYNIGEIIRISYNDNFVTAKIYNDKESLGNNNGAFEYFEITNKGLINVTNKFIDINPIDISNNTKDITVSGNAKPNSKVNIKINNKNIVVETNYKGNFNADISGIGNINTETSITFSSEDYINTLVYPKLVNNYNLKNSYINFYYNPNWEYSKLSASIGFNVNNNTFYVNSYVKSFGNGKTNYFDLSLYNKDGTEIFNQGFKNDTPLSLSSFLDNKKFNYGDIIGISYNNSISKPIILNGTSVLGNVSGGKEYFEITKNGLVSVSFGNKATGTNINWKNNNLNINANLSMGISNSLLTANKNLVLINSDGKVVESSNAKTTNNNGVYSVSGIFTESSLNNIKKGQVYTIGIDINNNILPIYVNEVNTPSTSKYILSQNEKNELSICTQGKKYVQIKNSNQIKNYLNTVKANLNNTVNDSNNIIDLNTNSNMKNEVYITQFINTIGLNNLEKMYNESTQNANFINWVLNNNTAMQEFLNGPNPSGSSVIQEQQPATYAECLHVWSNIWNEYTSSHTGFNLKLAIAVSLTNGKEMKAWPSSGTVGNPVQRYNIFETLSSTNQMLPEFYTLDVSHLCYVVDTIVPNDQIMEMRSIILQNHNGLINTKELNDIAYTINYNENNPHTGASIFGNNFYGPNPTVKDVWYDGGVCGSTSRMGVMGDQMFGIPAAQTPQPGHDAFIYDQNGQWIVGNDVYGWQKTYQADLSGWSKNITTNYFITSYDILYQKADTKALKESNNYLLLSNSISGYSQKVEYIKKAIKIQPLNLGAWLDLVNIYKINPFININQYNELVKNIINEFKAYPQPMYDLLYQLKEVYINNGSVIEYNNYVNSIKNALQSVTSGEQKPIAENLLNQMSSNGLVDNRMSISKIQNYSIQLNDVWNYSLGEFKFDSSNNTILINKGGYETNPYRRGLAFKIALENSEGKILKQLKINYADSNAPNEIYNCFNNLKFNYGDKFVIYDQDVNDGHFIINNLITPNGNVSNYKLTNNNITLYITKKGLSLTSNATIYNGYAKVTMQDIDGKTMGNPIKLSGELTTPILVNGISIPKGYELSELLSNGTAIYKGNNLLDAEYDIAHLNYETKINNLIFVIKPISIKSNSNNKKINEIENSNTKNVYWDGRNLVINGNLSNSMNIPEATVKKLVIKNQEGNTISTINTVPLNWYSQDKNNYSGYQGIITENVLSKLEQNKTYSIFIDVNGKDIPLINKSGSPYNENYIVETNSLNQLTLSKATRSLEKVSDGLGTYEIGYFTNSGYVINGNVSLNNNIFSKDTNKVLLIKNSKGRIIDRIDCAPVNWYSSNKENYSGFQGIIPNSILSNLMVGDSYNLFLEVIKGDKAYEMPINNNKNFKLNCGINYDILTNSKDNVSIEKVKSYTVVDLGKANLNKGYWQSYGYVMNIRAKIEKELNQGTLMELVSKSEDGKINSITRGIPINWYSPNKKNYNGLQAIITPEQLKGVSSGDKLYVRIYIDGKIYETSLTGNIDTYGKGRLNYGFKSLDNNVEIILKK